METAPFHLCTCRQGDFAGPGDGVAGDRKTTSTGFAKSRAVGLSPVLRTAVCFGRPDAECPGQTLQPFARLTNQGLRRSSSL